MGDLDEIDDTVKLGLEFIFAEKIQDVLDAALVRKPNPEDITYEIVKSLFAGQVKRQCRNR